jgi:hypothetical protein
MRSQLNARTLASHPYHRVMPLCALCLCDRELSDSHLVPKFVFDYLKRTSATGYLRFSSQPNRRVQDGRKLPMLCTDCERRFSILEKAFAEIVFQPYTKDRAAVIQYDSRLLKFAVSLSWRILTYYYGRGHLGNVAAKHIPRVQSALERWRKFLLGEVPHPAGYEQHLLPMDELESVSGFETPTNINRYIIRSVDMDVVSGTRSVFVYTKLPRLTFIGMVEMDDARRAWKGTRIALRSGTIRPRKFVVPEAFGEYMMGKARLAAAALASMSDKQKALVDVAALSDLERLSASETISAMASDVDMFGLAAFAPPERDRSET